MSDAPSPMCPTLRISVRPSDVLISASASSLTEMMVRQAWQAVEWQRLDSERNAPGLDSEGSDWVSLPAPTGEDLETCLEGWGHYLIEHMEPWAMRVIQSQGLRTAFSRFSEDTTLPIVVKLDMERFHEHLRTLDDKAWLHEHAGGNPADLLGSNPHWDEIGEWFEEQCRRMVLEQAAKVYWQEPKAWFEHLLFSHRPLNSKPRIKPAGAALLRPILQYKITKGTGFLRGGYSWMLKDEPFSVRDADERITELDATVEQYIRLIQKSQIAAEVVRYLADTPPPAYVREWQKPPTEHDEQLKTSKLDLRLKGSIWRCTEDRYRPR